MRYFPAVLCGGLLLLTGCGGSSDGPPYATVSGVVTLDGNPVEGATVIFTPKGPGTMSMGLTNADGAFSLMTSTGKRGAAVGDHAVTVTLMIQPEQKATGSADDLAEMLPTEYASDAAAAAAAKNAKAAEPVYLIPRKYSDAKTSGLDVTVPSGGLKGHQIELKSR